MPKKNYSASEKFVIGFRALNGETVDEITTESGMNRSYIYEQKNKAQAYVEALDKDQPEAPMIVLTNALKKRLILSMALDCASSIEGIQRALEAALDIKVSTGYISEVIKEASIRAQSFDDTISLEGIRQGANDEIFQCGAPILTGIPHMRPQHKRRFCFTNGLFSSKRTGRYADVCVIYRRCK